MTNATVDGGKGKTYARLLLMQTHASTMKISVQVPQKVKNVSTTQILHFLLHAKRIPYSTLKRSAHPCSLILSLHNSHGINREMHNELCYRCTMEYYSDIKKNKIVNVWNNHSSKVTQIQKEKYYMVFSYPWVLALNLQIHVFKLE